jgi:DNA mismatch repair protein MutS2
VESDAGRLAAERAALDTELAAARQARSETEAELKAAREEARNVKAKARAEAREVVASLRQKLRELSRAAALKQTELKAEAAGIEALTRKLEPGAAEREEASTAPVPELHPGDRVRIPRWNRSAVVLAARQGQIELEVDGKRLSLSHREVMPIEPLRRGQAAYTAPGWGAELLEQEGAPDRLNLIGLRVDEALAELERFIDRAGANGPSVLTIIHGLGTGALKAAVAQYLKNHPIVASLRPGGPAEGGAGVTVAELKK